MRCFKSKEVGMNRFVLAFFSIAALSSPASAQTVFGLVGSDRLVTFDAASPGIITSNQPITGLGSGEILTGIDIRPLDNLIYAVSTSGNVYRLDPAAGSYNAVLTGTVQNFPPPGTPIPVSGQNFGIDFNPVPDRIRLVSDLDQNLRINPLNGGTAVDTPINDGAGGSPYDIIGVAYTNSAAGAVATTLYGIDAVSSSLLRSTNPNGGVYVNTNLAGTAFQPLGLALSGRSQVGFDIFFNNGVNSAFLSADNNFYGIDLGTGTASLIGGIGISNVRGITTSAVPEPATWGMMLAGFGLVGAAMRTKSRRRTLARATI
jgi:hypothetical protein